MAMEKDRQDIEESIKALKDCFVEVTESLELLDENEWNKKLSQMINSIKSARTDAVFIKNEEEEKQKRRENEEKSRMKQLFDMQTPDGYGKAETNFKNVEAYELDKAFYMSLREFGKIDIEYISAITSLSLRDVIIGLGDAIYQNPLKWEKCFYKGYETKSEYLSGNIIAKLLEAEKLNEEYKGYFNKNIEALKLVLPTKIPAEQLFISLGVTWIDGAIIEKFLKELFNAKRSLKIYYYEKVEEWIIEYPYVNNTKVYDAREYLSSSARTTSRYGTKRVPALTIVERTLNNHPIEVYDYIETSTAKRKRVLNNTETMLALEKQKLIQQEFKKWVLTHPDDKDNIENTYYRKFGCVVARKFDGAFLEFPDKNPNINLYDYQKNAIARIIETNNTLLAHDVGTGKTYIMIGAGMEMRRMGISKKNMYVVPNNIVGQWSKSFFEMYPKANILSISPQDFTPTKRDEVVKKIKDNDYDGIIIAYSCFEMLPMTTKYYKQEIKDMLKQIESASKNAILYSQYGPLNTLNKRNSEMRKLLNKMGKEMDADIPKNCFDDLGINSLFVDEAHNFKNIGIKTKCQNLRGVTCQSSQKCEQMMLKTKYIMDSNNGRGVIFATGTPICNSISDLYVMQQYLQAGELKMLEISTFDNWAAMFIEKSSEFEIDVDTNNYRKIDRLAKYNNL
ncbi:MAG: DEAD/DEAH box helicase family protein, partial [Clostridia bacterium]